MRREMRQYPYNPALTLFFVLGEIEGEKCVAFFPKADPRKSPTGTKFCTIIKSIAESCEKTEDMIVGDEEIVDEYIVLSHIPRRFRHAQLLAAVGSIVAPLMTVHDQIARRILDECLPE